MISLFGTDAELNATRFLARNADKTILFTSTGFLSRLHYAAREAPGEPFDQIEVRPINVATLKQLSKLDGEGGFAKTFVVADESGEGKRLASLRATYPHLKFAGLAENLFPALVARRQGVALRPMPGKLQTRTLTMIFAPPRSGSSFVSDVVSQVTGTKIREHLRNDVIEALASPYRFNLAVALRNFLNLITNDAGHASTKIISHFLQDYVGQAGSLKLVKRVCEGLDVKVIVVERDDKVAQTVSGFLAMRRGVWHLESARDAAAIEAAPQVGYDFDRLLPRYLGYRHQSYVLDFAREIFPDHLLLEYGRDLEAGDAAALGQRVANFLGLPPEAGQIETKAVRAKLANEENQRLCTRFRADYDALFGLG